MLRSVYSGTGYFRPNASRDIVGCGGCCRRRQVPRGEGQGLPCGLANCQCSDERLDSLLGQQSESLGAAAQWVRAQNALGTVCWSGAPVAPAELSPFPVFL